MAFRWNASALGTRISRCNDAMLLALSAKERIADKAKIIVTVNPIIIFERT